MERTALKIGVGFLIGLAAAYIIFGLPGKKGEGGKRAGEAPPAPEGPSKRKIIPFPFGRLARSRQP